MSSASALWRKHMKDDNPEKYQEYLRKAKERNKKRRDEKKRKWEVEPHTRAAIQEREHENELARFVYW